MTKKIKMPDLPSDDHHLSLQLMHEYLEDNLPEKQMHQIERHLLDCELCSDALEGLSFLEDPKEADLSINHLKRKVRKRSLREPVIRRKRKQSPLPWRHLSVAAATIIMVVGSILVFKLNSPKQSKKQESTISLNKDHVQATQENAPSTVQQVPAYSDALPIEEKTTTSRSKAKAGKSNRQLSTDSKESEAKGISESNVSLSPEVALDEIEEQVKDKDLIASQENIQSLKPPMEIAEAKREMKPADALLNKTTPVPSGAVGITQNFITVSGKVAAASDTTMVLPGVKVSIKNTNKSVLTDYRGRFSMAVPPSSTLIFSLEGMSNTEVSVLNRKIINVLLKSEGDEEEILTDGATAEEVADEQLYSKPQPENGTMSYRNYLKKNLKYPVEAKNNNIQGNVRVEFIVKPDGQLSDVKIRKGLGYGCDEEALRLIKEGPAWKPAISNGKKVERRISVYVPFKL